jgi:hypothetical protein
MLLDTLKYLRQLTQRAIRIAQKFTTKVGLDLGDLFEALRVVVVSQYGLVLFANLQATNVCLKLDNVREVGVPGIFPFRRGFTSQKSSDMGLQLGHYLFL